MNLNCLTDIIIDNLAIHIDISDEKSWNLNTGFTCISLTKSNSAISDDINLIDYGLTAFDIGRTDKMWSGTTLTQNDNFFQLTRIGYNDVINPSKYQSSGYTAMTKYDLYPINAIITGDSGNYLDLNGGWLSGFFKLHEYNYQTLPSRFNDGITIETLLYLKPESRGIFYMMGLNMEDKYNLFFSGETITGGSETNLNITGVTTSEDNYLNSFKLKNEYKKSFRDFNNRFQSKYVNIDSNENIKNNIIAFEITDEKKLKYSYVNTDGIIISEESTRLLSKTGWTYISITFVPNTIIDDADIIDCFKNRIGTLNFYVNGNLYWIIKEFPEFKFTNLINDREKQIGVPYTINWGGGSFGLKHSWHYDYQTYCLYDGENTQYVNDTFFVQKNPIPDECVDTNDNYLSGLSLSADSTTFTLDDDCDPNIKHPITVMKIEYTGSTANTFFVKYNKPISILSNREYEINLSIFNDGIFKEYDLNNNQNINKISLLIYSDDVDVIIIDDIEYAFPITQDMLNNATSTQLRPYPDKQEYQYEYNGVLYYGVTGVPIVDMHSYIYGNKLINDSNYNAIVTGINQWIPLKSIFKITENTGKKNINIGLLIQSTDSLNDGNSIFVTNFTYKGADILKQDNNKKDLLIEKYFNSSFIGGIQKLRIYTKAFNSAEIRHNCEIEQILNPNLNLNITKGGRIIFG